VLLLAWLASLAACAEPARGVRPAADAGKDVTTPKDTGAGEVSGDVPDGGDVETPPLSFADDGVHDVLVDNCMAGGCHGSAAGGFAIIDDVEADYAATLNRVTPGDATTSLLVKKGTATSSHGGGPVLVQGTSEYDLLVRWIDDGANP